MYKKKIENNKLYSSNSLEWNLTLRSDNWANLKKELIFNL